MGLTIPLPKAFWEPRNSCDVSYNPKHSQNPNSPSALDTKVELLVGFFRPGAAVSFPLQRPLQCRPTKQSAQGMLHCSEYFFISHQLAYFILSKTSLILLSHLLTDIKFSTFDIQIQIGFTVQKALTPHSSPSEDRNRFQREGKRKTN